MTRPQAAHTNADLISFLYLTTKWCIYKDPLRSVLSSSENGHLATPLHTHFVLIDLVDFFETAVSDFLNIQKQTG